MTSSKLNMPREGDLPENKTNLDVIAKDHSIINDVTQIYTTVVLGHPSNEVKLRNRKALLKKVHRIWIKDYLDNSLENMGWIDIDLVYRPEEVMRPNYEALSPQRNLHLELFRN